jgi:hypothetical protein
MARAAEVECSASSICKRCGQEVETAHDNSFCPAFAKSGEVGRWIPFSNILSAIRAELGTGVEVRHSCRTEAHEGPRNEWTNVVGLYHNGEFIGRFDSPYVPEYSLWTDRRSQHSMLMKGWRASLRDIGTKTGVRFERSSKTSASARTTRAARRSICASTISRTSKARSGLAPGRCPSATATSASLCSRGGSTASSSASA